jgi:hypothetical protein
MIHELRIYTFHPGKLPTYLKLAEEVGIPIRGQDYGIREGGWMTEFGTLNQFWHVWRYDSLNERAEKRKALAANKAWTSDFVPQIRPLLARQQVLFLHPQRPLTAPDGKGNVYEMRYYRAQLGRAPEFVGSMLEAMPHREKYSKNVCLWTCEAPDPHDIYHLWAYPSLNQRFEMRGGAVKDPGWQAFLGKGPGMLEQMHSTLLIPAAFSALQ